MAERKNYGRTASGKLLTDELIEKYANEAEEGYDVNELKKNLVILRPLTPEELEQLDQSD